jgi:NAD(P)-dependent dehydrogenase (short-subunit alcohol dehydrogenase family)
MTKNILITGASGGIGRATVEALARNGHRVFAAMRKPSGRFDSLPDVTEVQLDVTDPASIASARQLVASAVGGLDGLVNNAGLIVQGPVELVPETEWRRQFEVNTIGPVLVLQEFLPLVRSRPGRIVNVSAPTARVALPYLAPISASKAALSSLSDALRIELAPWRVPVSVVEPGSTETEIFTKADEDARRALSAVDPHRLRAYQRQIEAVAAATSAQKLDDVAPVVRAIISALEDRRPRRRYTVGSARTLGMLTKMPAGMRESMIASNLGLSKTTPEQ